jgi:tetratricopeptide (TPR) repeat protein
VTGDLEAALADCNEALRRQPNVAEAFDSRGFIYLKKGQWDAALADYNAALRLAPRLASALYGRGFVRLKKGETANGNADIVAAKAAYSSIDEDFKRYGVP